MYRHLWLVTSALACSLVAIFNSISTAQEPSIARVKSDWSKLRSSISICSGEITGKSTATRSTQNFGFAIRHQLVKRLDAERNGDAVHVLWNDRGTFIVRQPKGQRWSLGGVFDEDAFEMRERSPSGYANSAISVLLHPMDELLDNRDYLVTCCEPAADREGLVKLCVKFKPGMDSFDWNSVSNSNPAPVFDSVNLFLDEKHLCRIVSYELDRTVQGNRGWIHATYDYSDQADSNIPTKLELAWGVAGSKKTSRTDEVKITADLTAPDANEFTLDYYDIDAPGGNRIPWYSVPLVAAAAVVALLAFFRRNSNVG